MSAIGRTHHNRCTVYGCTKRRPYWSDKCKQHRDAEPKVVSKYTIEKAYTQNSRCNLVPDGFDLFCEGNWAQRFRTKNEARYAKRDLERIDALNAS